MYKYTKNCAVCGREFKTDLQRKNLCSFDCRQEANRERSRAIMRRKRHPNNHKYPPCEGCGYTRITEMHHEGRERHQLCPNCHRLVTTGRDTLENLLSTYKKEKKGER